MVNLFDGFHFHLFNIYSLIYIIIQKQEIEFIDMLLGAQLGNFKGRDSIHEKEHILLNFTSVPPGSLGLGRYL